MSFVPDGASSRETSRASQDYAFRNDPARDAGLRGLLSYSQLNGFRLSMSSCALSRVAELLGTSKGLTRDPEPDTREIRSKIVTRSLGRDFYFCFPRRHRTLLR